MEDLPEHCSFSPLGGARINEILALKNHLDTIEHGQRAYQNLPRHMQRRAMCGNPRRVPRGIRDKHIRELKNKVAITKRPCRKYRRRPSNLVREYNRRQGTNKWLETHIFHAKRFHMTRKWGYAISSCPTNKGHQATLRAAKYTCLMQDISYMCCIEIRGTLNYILDGLSLITPLDQHKLNDVDYLTGQSWCSVFLYANNRFPLSAIGPADILWHPEINTGATRTLWLWVHPSTYEEVLSNLVEVYTLSQQQAPNDNNSDIHEAQVDSDKKTEDSSDSKISTRNVPFSRVPRYQSSSSDVSVYVLKDTLNRFRLIGPLSYTVLSRVLVPSSVKEERDLSESELGRTSDAPHSWWRDYYSNTEHKRALEEQTDSWQNLSHSSCTEPRVLPLVVRDPRSILPKKKLRLDTPPHDDTHISSKWSVTSPIYDSNIRDDVTLSMCSTADVNKRRSEQLVTLPVLPLTSSESRVPVLLLNRLSPYNSKESGWDVILPCGWGAVTWHSLHLSGGVSSGQGNEEHLIQELLLPPTPHLLPDTSAGIIEAQARKFSTSTTYFKRPPNCRMNFIKLSTQFPFSCPWLKLMKDWYPTVSDIKVMRCHQNLEDLSLLYPLKNKEHKEEISNERRDTIIKNLELKKDYLVHVHIQLISKGTLEPNAMMCLPNQTDQDNIDDIYEPQSEDNLSERRKKLKEEHHKIHNRLQRLKYRSRRKLTKQEEEAVPMSAGKRESIKDAMKIINDENQDLIKKNESYCETMNSLWLLPESQPLQMCSRKIVGYCLQGGFSSILGRCAGRGYVVLGQLLHLNKQKILVRNPLEHKYRWAQISVIIPFQNKQL